MNNRPWHFLLLAVLIVPAPAAAQQPPLETAPAAEVGNVQAQEEQAIKAAVTQVAPAVVRIETVGGLERVGQVTVGTGPTTGLIVSGDGLIVSSAFNFAQLPTSILVTVPGTETRVPAKIVARDESRMLVLLKIDVEQPLPVPQAAPRDELAVGQWAIAIGRTYAADHVSLSTGVLSAKSRIWGKAVQTDAKISPANYGGPLVDIFGRVIGVLVPLSPQGQGAVAGAEWYDSGIGFAIPLADVMRRLDDWRQGQDLQPGLLGIQLKGTDIYALPAVVASVRIKSPAADAGVKAGDRIVEVNGVPIDRQAQLKHALGPLYAGDTVQIAVLRDGQRVQLEAVLTDTLVPYDTPYFGVLPERVGDAFVVRHVLADSPAAAADVRPGDRVVKWNGEPVASGAEGRQAAGLSEAGDEVTWTIDRGGESLELKLKSQGLPDVVPPEVPIAPAPADPPAGPQPATGVVEIKIVEEKNECAAYVPSTYRHDLPHSLLVWLHEPGKFDQDQLVADWKQLCEDRGVILLMPQSADARRWTAPEIEFIRKAIDDVQQHYTIDPERLVVGGAAAGGAMAYLLAFQSRDLVRGVVAIDAPVPRRVALPENDPAQRLAFFAIHSEKSQLAEPIQQAIDKLREAKFPVTARQLPGDNARLGPTETDEVARWIDLLDRI